MASCPSHPRDPERCIWPHCDCVRGPERSYFDRSQSATRFDPELQFDLDRAKEELDALHTTPSSNL